MIDMKKKALFLILILLMFNLQIIGILGATDEGYGEDETALGQFVDSFENDDNITVMNDVIVNVTLECVELNFSTGAPAGYENFTLYTEVDANNRFAVSDYIIVIESLNKYDKNHYVVYDYGAGFFTDFTHDLDVRVRDNSGSAGNDAFIAWMLTNTLDDYYDLWNANEDFLMMLYYEFDNSDPNDPNIWLSEEVNKVHNNDIYEPASLNVWYYMRIVKSGTSLVCGIYSTHLLREAGDGTDGNFDNLAITLNEDYSFRYLFIVSDFYTGGSGTRLISGDVHNLDLNLPSGGYDLDGYFLTDDYLNDTVCNGTSLVLMTNSTIPENTDIYVQFSNDNSTWILNDWEPMFGGFESIDLRILNYTDIYFMFNLTTTNPLITPRLYQARLISTIGNSTGGPPAGPSGSRAIGFIMLILICTPIIILLVWRTRKR